MEGNSCQAGVTYLSLGSGKQWPCHGDIGQNISVCTKHEPFTHEELEAKNKKRNETNAFFVKALDEINLIKGNGGTIACPKCQNSLQWSRHLNGHIHGWCSTKDCLSWMQ